MTDADPGTLALVILFLAIIGGGFAKRGRRHPRRPRTSAPSGPKIAAPTPRATPVAPMGAPPVPGALEGRAYVIDGDTIVIARQKIRLAGIDAPELDHPYGQKSKWAMVAICKGRTVTARLTGETSHDRLVAVCTLEDGRDIGAELIKAGLALDWALFSGGKYRHLEPRGVRRRLMAARHAATRQADRTCAPIPPLRRPDAAARR